MTEKTWNEYMATLHRIGSQLLEEGGLDDTDKDQMLDLCLDCFKNIEVDLRKMQIRRKYNWLG